MQLRFDPGPTPDRHRPTDPSHAPARVRLVEEDDAARPAAEDFVARIYAAAYCARLTRLMPELLALYAEGGELLAALGLRVAAAGPLYLEHYLDGPVEAELGAALAPFDARIERETLVEVGNLASVHAGGTRWLIVGLTAFLQGAGFDWVVFTATRSLRNSFTRLGLRLLPLGPARPERLGAAERARWGDYYAHGPQVVAVNVHHTFGVLDRYLRVERAAAMLQTLWCRAHALGALRLNARIAS